MEKTINEKMKDLDPTICTIKDVTPKGEQPKRIKKISDTELLHCFEELSRHI